MSNKTSMLFGAALAVLGTSAVNADSVKNYLPGGGWFASGPDTDLDQNRTAFGNGYSYGYDDGYADRLRKDRYRSEFYQPRGRYFGASHGAYYYVGVARNDGQASNAGLPAALRK